ncbi:MAG: hypothetical protein QF363_12500 [Planctomycetaceae bacterium]|mgnify:CR=1 FL=1|nr:hypothetical protein [Planctomycetaceae bacterium]
MTDCTRRMALGGLLGTMAGLVGCDRDGGFGFWGTTDNPSLQAGSFLGQPPPSIESGGTWLNVESPLSAKKMAGKVIWLEFSFLH